MSLGTLFEFVAFPAIFLIVATVNPRNLPMKVVCIALAYYSLVLADGWVCMGNTVGTATRQNALIMGKDSSPYSLVCRLVCLAITLWGFVLVVSSAGKSEKENKSQ